MNEKSFGICPIHHKPKTGVIYYCQLCRVERGRKGGTARGKNLSQAALRKIALKGVAARAKK